MKKRIIMKATFDGFIQGLIFIGLGVFSVSTFSAELSPELFLLIGITVGFLSSIGYFILARKTSGAKELVSFSIFSFLCFFLSAVAMLVLRLTFRFHLVPIRDANNADGLLIIFSTGSYLLFSIILRVLIFISMIIRNTCKVGKANTE